MVLIKKKSSDDSKPLNSLDLTKALSRWSRNQQLTRDFLKKEIAKLELLDKKSKARLLSYLGPFYIPGESQAVDSEKKDFLTRLESLLNDVFLERDELFSISQVVDAYVSRHKTIVLERKVRRALQQFIDTGLIYRWSNNFRLDNRPIPSYYDFTKNLPGKQISITAAQITENTQAIKAFLRQADRTKE